MTDGTIRKAAEAARRLEHPPNYIRSIIARGVRSGRFHCASDEGTAEAIMSLLNENGFKIVETENRSG